MTSEQEFYEIDATIELRLNGGNNPTVLADGPVRCQDGKESVDAGAVRSHSVSVHDIAWHLFRAIGELIEGHDDKADELKAYAVECAENIIQNYGKQDEA